MAGRKSLLDRCDWRTGHGCPMGCPRLDAPEEHLPGFLPNPPIHLLLLNLGNRPAANRPKPVEKVIEPRLHKRYAPLQNTPSTQLPMKRCCRCPLKKRSPLGQPHPPAPNVSPPRADVFPISLDGPTLCRLSAGAMHTRRSPRAPPNGSPQRLYPMGRLRHTTRFPRATPHRERPARGLALRHWGGSTL